MQNFISMDLSDEDLDAVKGTLGVLKEKLEPHLKALTPVDRQEMLKMGIRRWPLCRNRWNIAIRIPI